MSVPFVEAFDRLVAGIVDDEVSLPPRPRIRSAPRAAVQDVFASLPEQRVRPAEAVDRGAVLAAGDDVGVAVAVDRAGARVEDRAVDVDVGRGVVDVLEADDEAPVAQRGDDGLSSTLKYSVNSLPTVSPIASKRWPRITPLPIVVPDDDEAAIGERRHLGIALVRRRWSC